MTFGDREFWMQQKQIYHRAFMPLDSLLMKDVSRFCKVKVTVARDNPNLTYLLEGRRQFFLRIQQHLELDEEALAALFPNMEEYYG